MAGVQPYALLNTGAKMPLMAFGTLMESLNPDHERVVKIMETALDVGYRHFDGAKIYNTEKMIGEALQNKIQQGLVKREDVFITTKLWRNSFEKDAVVPALRQSLKDLGLDYVDLFLIHWPTAFKCGPELFPKDESDQLIFANTDYLDTWRGMEEAFNLGLTKAIGLSNFNSKQIQRILENCKVQPANNQVESHPYLTNSKLVKFCQERNITVTAYAPLAGFRASFRESQGWPTIYTDGTIKKIAARHSKTPAQVALRYQIQRGVAVAPKSARPDRMRENFEALSFELTEDDMILIESGNVTYRLNQEFPDHPYYPFHEEF